MNAPHLSIQVESHLFETYLKANAFLTPFYSAVLKKWVAAQVRGGGLPVGPPHHDGARAQRPRRRHLRLSR
jgi:hypothetical protein